ncbi:hypothetical protein ACHAXS_009357 [Conticribra weissflogii]
MHPPESWEEDLEKLKRTKLFLVSRKGPLLFVLKADDNTNVTYKVVIGSPQRCSCGGGEAKGKACVHIMFVMIKCFRLQPSNPLAWQITLREEDVVALLDGRQRNTIDESSAELTRYAFLKKGDGAKLRLKSNANEDGSFHENDSFKPDGTPGISQKELAYDDICTICQDTMTELELADNQLTFCGNCGSNFHAPCFRTMAAYSKSQRKHVTCPLCRAQWQNTILPASKINEHAAQMTQTRKLPRIRCEKCKMSIQGKVEFARCTVCPSMDLCKICFNRGCQDCAHPFVSAGASEYPSRWKPLLPNFRGSQRKTNEKNQLMMLQYRNLSPADYHELLTLDSGLSNNVPPLYEHLANALDEVESRSLSVEKCGYCSVPLSIDRTARRCPCHCTVHWSCAVRIILTGLASSECEGALAGKIVCPMCENDGTTTILFPALNREPVIVEPARKRGDTSKVALETKMKNAPASSNGRVVSDFELPMMIQSLSIGVVNNQKQSNRCSVETQAHRPQKKSTKTMSIRSSRNERISLNNNHENSREEIETFRGSTIEPSCISLGNDGRKLHSGSRQSIRTNQMRHRSIQEPPKLGGMLKIKGKDLIPQETSPKNHEAHRE